MAARQKWHGDGHSRGELRDLWDPEAEKEKGLEIRIHLARSCHQRPTLSLYAPLPSGVFSYRLIHGLTTNGITPP